MPHYVNIDGMHESLFLLQQLQVASRQYCEKHKIQRATPESEDIDWEYYSGMLKSSVCDHLIQVSTKLRILQDIIRQAQDGPPEESFNLTESDEAARDGLIIATEDVKGTSLSVRETCNKVLHATDTTLEWNDSTDSSFEFWTGKVRLEGKYMKEEWKVSLDVEKFAFAVYRYLRDIEYNVDLPRIYKHDE